jgi:chemotaxis protein methyltransferase CheR
VSSSDAVSIGLIVTEAVINALKHAFKTDEKDGRIVVSYEVTGDDWKLAVTDNGMGKPETGPDVAKAGLGTSIVNALAQQLDARVDLVTGPEGTSVSVTHVKLLCRYPPAA